MSGTILRMLRNRRLMFKRTAADNFLIKTAYYISQRKRTH
jgi:hypothetical protein